MRRASAVAAGRFGSCRNAASTTFSSTVNLRKGLTIWKVRATPRLTIAFGRRPTSSWPSSRTEPVNGSMKPDIRLNTVVLPAPFGPIRPRISPWFNTKERSDTARRPPKSLERLLTSSNAMAAYARCGESRSTRRSRPQMPSGR